MPHTAVIDAILCSCSYVTCGCVVFVGVLRWQSRVWFLVSRLISQRSSADSQQPWSCSLDSNQLQQIEVDVFNARNFALKEVSDGLQWQCLAANIVVSVGSNMMYSKTGI